MNPVDRATAALASAFRELAPSQTIDPAASLATGREPREVYGIVFQDAGCPFADGERRALALVATIDRVLGELYAELGEAAELVPVVPQLHQHLVRPARAELVSTVRSGGGPQDWIDATVREPEWLLQHPAGTR